MGKFDGVLLCTDFDGTYYSDRVHPDNRKLVEYFQSEGGRFTVATGRNHRTFSPQLPLISLNAPAVLSNGGQLYDFQRDEMLLEYTLPAQAAEDVALLTRQFPEVGLELYHGEELYIWNPNQWTHYHIQRVGIEATEGPVEEAPTPWDKGIFSQEEELLLSMQAYILERWGDRYDAVFSRRHMLELTAKGANKGAMVLELAKRLGIQREHIYCVGDNQNDLSMLAVAATAFAPDNCSQEVRDTGAVILPPCDEGAVAALIRILDEKY